MMPMSNRGLRTASNPRSWKSTGLVVSVDEIGVWPFDGPGQAIPARSQKGATI